MLSFSLDLWEGFSYQGDEKPYTAGRPDGRQTNLPLGARPEGAYRPSLDGYILKSEEARPAVLILPGSGYYQCSPREAEAVAIRFNAAGYHSFVLWYSCFPQHHPVPILDCARAMSLIRENAPGWKIDQGRIALMGFSAGGHLALSETIYHDRDFAAAPGINPGTTRADALLLCYPVISTGPATHKGSFEALLGKNPDPALLELLSLENQIKKESGLPPVFLWHTWTDDAVPVENSLLLATALKQAGIPLEMHIFPEGKHGLSLAIRETAAGDAKNIDPLAAQWFGLCLNWLGHWFEKKSRP